jgi:NitT/TauT family transport system substrate-binding protein
LLAACGDDDDNTTAAQATDTTTAGSQTTQPRELTKVKLGVFPNNLFSLGIEVARLGGFFQKNGLDPDFFYVTKGGPELTSALAGGSILIGENSLDNLILARKQGLDMVTVAGNVQKMPFSMVLRKGVACDAIGKPYPAPMKCLEGKTVGVTALGASTDLFTREMMKAAGANIEATKFVAVGGPTTAYPALKAGQIDGFLAFEPMQTMGRVEGVSQVIVDLRKGDGPADFKDVAYNTWWALGKTVKDKPDVIKAFQKTVADATEFILDKDNLDKVVKYAREVFPSQSLDDAAFRQLIEDTIPTVGDQVTERSVKAWSDFLLKVGLIDKPVTRSELVADGVPS